jgi:hypothetical protein
VESQLKVAVAPEFMPAGDGFADQSEKRQARKRAESFMVPFRTELARAPSVSA